MADTLLIKAPEGWNPVKMALFEEYMSQGHFIAIMWKDDKVQVVINQVTPDKVARAGAHLTNVAREDVSRLQAVFMEDSNLSPGEWERVAQSVLEDGRSHYYLGRKKSDG